MVVSHNIPALQTHLSMRRSDRGLAAAMQRLSTGFQINSAKDDAAGLAIANKLSFQIGGLTRASENATHGISLVQTAEGALNEVHNMLQRMRELAVQAANDTNTADDRRQIYREIEQLTDEIHAVANRTEFNRMRILNGEADRVTEMFEGHMPVGSGIFDQNHAAVNISRSVVSRLFIAGVNPGRLEYTIESIGTNAYMPIDIPTGTIPDYLVGTRLNVNGESMTVSPGSWSNFMAQLNANLEFTGITVQTADTGDTFLVTNLAGSNQHITFGGSAALMTALGLSTEPVRGTDAVVTIRALYDILGNPAADPNSLAVATNGNQINIRGTQGEDIRLNIQVNFNPNAPNNFSFGNGDDVLALAYPGGTVIDDTVDPPVISDPVPAVPLQKTLSIREFGPLKLQTGPSHNNAIDIQIPRLNAETLGLVEYVAGQRRSMLLYTTSLGAQEAIRITDNAISTVSAVRARLGAFQNRLESTVDSLNVAAENTQRSRSRIKDTDMARESTRFATYNVMFQAAQAMLAQANQRPQMLLSLMQ